MEEHTQNDSLATTQRVVSVSERAGKVTGACIYVTAADLAELGISPSEAERVTVSIDPSAEQIELKPREVGEQGSKCEKNQSALD
ncbi:hypothetical protein [Halovenus sp. HT40]|uniref:hypothetical protein n=1 Tax=Halovenus sp. HT40 TaxID=3126691 RepID=UPI00300E8C60